MSQSAQEEGAVNATTARNSLYSLVKLAEEQGRTTVITKHKVRALLAPLDRFPAARKTDAFPAHVLSTAQRTSATSSRWRPRANRRCSCETPLPSRCSSPPTPLLMPSRPTRPRTPARRPQEVR